MKLDLSEIVSEVGKRLTYEFREPPLEDLGDDIACVGEVRGKITFSNAAAALILRGKAVAEVELTCSRCLSPYRETFDMDISEEIPLAEHAPDGAEQDFEDLPEDEKEPLFADNVFDLTEFLRQAVLVNVPMRTICSPECKGLCPGCGVNLNETNCKCQKDFSQNPFAELKSLLQDNDGE